MNHKEPIRQELVLLGGGHAHVEVVRHFAMNPISGVRVTLICRDIHTPYSGMLPGYIAGHYSYDEVHIDLAKLASWAGIRFIHDEIESLDPQSKVLRFCSHRPDLTFDFLSINTGSAPELKNVPGAAEFAVPVKPINAFLNRWDQLLQRVEGAKNAASDSAALKVCVVGAGAGGVELCLSLAQRFSSSDRPIEFELISRSERVLPTHPEKAQKIFETAFRDNGIKVQLGKAVTSVSKDHLSLSDGTRTPFDELLWVTKAGAPGWLARTGLKRTESGFLAVRDTLQVEGFDHIFAVGDVADVVAHPREKAGVFAVRQGPPVARNLSLVLQGHEAKTFAPQSSWLSLITTGNKFAVATRGRRVLAGRYMWRWKDQIDRKFMNRFGDLKPLAMKPKTDGAQPKMRCLGCGAKVGREALALALSEAKVAFPRVVDIEKDDAAQVNLQSGRFTKSQLWQTVDFLPSFEQDPWLFAKIATEHALSDIFAMGMSPSSAQLMLSLPPATGHVAQADLTAIMAGVCERLELAETKLIGGHSVEGEFGIGLVVNALGAPKFRKAGLKDGDALVLTKPLGSGLVLAGHMALLAKGRWLAEAWNSMLLSNAKASALAAELGAKAVTDVTGFGLAGHALEMAQSSGKQVVLNAASFPLLPGVKFLSEQGVRSSLFENNSSGFQQLTKPLQELAFDPQTGGGLLVSLPQAQAELYVESLNQEGHQAAIVGHVEGAVDSSAKASEFVVLN